MSSRTWATSPTPSAATRRLFQNVSGMGEGVGAEQQVVRPDPLFPGLMDASLTQEAVRPRATIIPMQSSSTVIPMFNLANRSTGIATLEGKLTAEGATGTTQKAALREVTLTAKKISVLVPTTTELLGVFATMLKDAMTEALAQTASTPGLSAATASAARSASSTRRRWCRWRRTAARSTAR